MAWSNILADFAIKKPVDKGTYCRHNRIITLKAETAVVVTKKGYASLVSLETITTNKGPGTGHNIMCVEKEDAIVAASIVQTGDTLLVINSDGFDKRT